MGELRFYEFFAGGGMARVGLGPGWTCAFANDNSPVKAEAYRERWGDGELDTRSIDEVEVSDLPRGADLAWASFPCQDLSQAGAGLGVGSQEDRTTRSSTLWPFLELMAGLRLEGRHPSLIVLENVTGLLSSNSGRDFRAICEALAKLGYVFGAVLIDARHFLAQSRPRIFVIGVREDLAIPEGLVQDGPSRPWHSAGLISAQAQLPAEAARRWRWWRLGEAPSLPPDALQGALDLTDGANWHDAAETDRLLGMMTAANRARLDALRDEGRPVVGSLYLRMRPEAGGNVQRAEIAFGDTLGCLRTPRGGASRPRIVVVDGATIRTRLVSPREAARLMGLPDDHPLPDRYQHAFQLIGDGVAVPVVRFLAERLLEPLVGRPDARPAAGVGTEAPPVREEVRA
jgi:DNA (cytosine-5)-methyltransferase 1